MPTIVGMPAGPLAISSATSVNEACTASSPRASAKAFSGCLRISWIPVVHAFTTSSNRSSFVIGSPRYRAMPTVMRHSVASCWARISALRTVIGPSDTRMVGADLARNESCTCVTGRRIWKRQPSGVRVRYFGLRAGGAAVAPGAFCAGTSAGKLADTNGILDTLGWASLPLKIPGFRAFSDQSELEINGGEGGTQFPRGSTTPQCQHCLFVTTSDGANHQQATILESQLCMIHTGLRAEALENAGFRELP